MARYILRADHRFFPEFIRPNGVGNNYQTKYQDIPLIPKGGTTNQVLAKSSNLDYDVFWRTITELTNANNGLTLNSTIAQLGGLLNQNTTINGTDTYDLTLTDILTLFLGASSIQLSADVSFLLRTPNVNNATASSGQFLRLNNLASGAADWSYLPLIDVFNNPANPYTVTERTSLIVADATAGLYTVNLKASPISGETVIVKKIDNVNNVDITPGVGHTIDGAAGAILNIQNQAITMTFDGVSMWVVTSRYL